MKKISIRDLRTARNMTQRGSFAEIHLADSRVKRINADRKKENFDQVLRQLSV